MISCSAQTHSVGSLALAGLAALGAATAFSTRRPDLGPAFHLVSPELRAPLLVLGHGPTQAPEPAPSRRRRGSTMTMGRVFPRGLGHPCIVMCPDRAVRTWFYETPERGEEGPTGVLVWFHGGGMISGSPAQDHPWCSRIAYELGLLVISVDYRLAPQHPFPAGLDDAFDVVAWVHEHAQDLDVDPRRIAVGGASAGGGIAAALAQRAHDAGVPLALQLLVYPMLDCTTGAGGVEVPGRGDFVWTAHQNVEAWKAYLGHSARELETRPYASPAQREDLRGLARAWVGVGDLDLFYAEDLAYADRLAQAGNRVTVRTEPGMYHGADYIPWAAAMREFRADALRSLREAVAA